MLYLGYLYKSEDGETHCSNKFYLDLLDKYDNQIDSTNSEAGKLSIVKKIVDKLSELDDNGCLIKARDSIKQVFPTTTRMDDYSYILAIRKVLGYNKEFKEYSNQRDNPALEYLKRVLNKSDKQELKYIMGLLVNGLCSDTINEVKPAMQATLERLAVEINRKPPIKEPEI